MKEISSKIHLTRYLKKKEWLDTEGIRKTSASNFVSENSFYSNLELIPVWDIKTDQIHNFE